MSRTSPSSDPMEREVNRLLAQLATIGTPSVRDPTDDSPIPVVPAAPSHARHTVVSGSSPTPSRRRIVALWARIILCITLAGFMTQWPYPRACGFPLLGYSGAITVVILSGVWVCLLSWKLRVGAAHVVSLMMLLWGLVLASAQVLPRVGYAAEVAAWECSVVSS